MSYYFKHAEYLQFYENSYHVFLARNFERDVQYIFPLIILDTVKKNRFESISRESMTGRTEEISKGCCLRRYGGSGHCLS